MKMHELVGELEFVSGSGNMMKNVVFVTPEGTRYGIKEVLAATNEIILMATQ